jgi:hypothetical protein
LRSKTLQRRVEREMIELMAASPTFWAHTDQITKILNAQWLKWGPSSLSLDILTSESQFHVFVVDGETKEKVDIQCKIKTVQSVSDPITPNTFFKRQIILRGPCNLNCTPNEKMNIRVHIEQCSQQFDHRIFRIGVSTINMTDKPVYSPSFYVGTKCRSETTPGIMTITPGEIHELRHPAANYVPRKRSRHEKLFDADSSSSDDEDSSDDEEEDVTMVKLEKLLDDKLNMIVERMSQHVASCIAEHLSHTNKQVVEHINRQCNALKKALDEFEPNRANTSPFSADMFNFDSLLQHETQ